MKTARLALSILALALVAKEVSALEGKWTPQQILELDPKWLREIGLEIPPEKLWSKDGAGLLEAVPSIEGCSNGFISAEGLMITNHHCAFGILQQHSTPENDLIANGFLARSRAEELGGTGTRATLPFRIHDKTAEIEAVAAGEKDDLARYRAIERKKKELVAECERQPNRRCQVATFDGGVQYLLFENIEYPDVRVVYAPPSAVGEYGGEIDNYAWPRHTGDFALLRVYAKPDGQPAAKSEANVPYRPRHHFPISLDGVHEGDFVLVAGYPGFTYRSYVEAEARERAEMFFPRQAALYRTWIDLMESATEKDPAGRIAVASRIKSAANNEKRALGRAEAVRRGAMIAKKKAAEQEVLAWAEKRPDQRPAVAAYRELNRLMEERLKTWDRDFLLGEVKNGARPLDLAVTVTRWARERTRPDLERDTAYMERNREKAAETLRNDQKRIYLPAEEAILADLLTRFAALPEGSRVEAVERLLGGDRTPEGIRARAKDVLARTRITDPEERARMFGETPEQLRARRDPLLDLAAGLQTELLALEERNHRFQGAVSRLRPMWRRAVAARAAESGRQVDPDGNATLRVSFARVQGYSPREAVRMEPHTTVAGMAAKHTGEPPFDAPDVLLAAAPSAPRSRWADPKLGDVPVDFLSDADTAGGSSGSPVLNGRGELVGVNFDRVWENVGSDFGWDQRVARNVNADVRYLFWLLETTYGDDARPLLREMGVDQARR